MVQLHQHVPMPWFRVKTLYISMRSNVILKDLQSISHVPGQQVGERMSETARERASPSVRRPVCVLHIKITRALTFAQVLVAEVGDEGHGGPKAIDRQFEFTPDGLAAGLLALHHNLRVRVRFLSCTTHASRTRVSEMDGKEDLSEGLSCPLLVPLARADEVPSFPSHLFETLKGRGRRRRWTSRSSAREGGRARAVGGGVRELGVWI